VKLGTENRRNTIIAAVLGVLAVLAVAYQFMPSSSTIASTAPAATEAPTTGVHPPPAVRRVSGSAGKKEKPPQSLDPTLHLQQLAATEQIKYEGSGRNIFVSQAAEVVIPHPVAPGDTDHKGPDKFQIPAVAAPAPIPLKFFGFASKPGETKKIFLSKGDDVWIVGEGEIVDRRYKVIRIASASVEIQDVVGSGPPQTIPLT
jgi:hypothetical protein